MIEAMGDVIEGVRVAGLLLKKVSPRSRNGGTDGDETKSNNERAEQDRESV